MDTLVQPQGHWDSSLYLPLFLPCTVRPRFLQGCLQIQHSVNRDKVTCCRFRGTAMPLESGLLFPSCLRPSTNSQGRQHDSQRGRNNVQHSANLLPCCTS